MGITSREALEGPKRRLHVAEQEPEVRKFGVQGLGFRGLGFRVGDAFAEGLFWDSDCVLYGFAQGLNKDGAKALGVY